MLYRGKKNAFFSTFWINFMECHSIQFTTISIKVERGIVKILFKYQYFQDLLIDIDIDIDIFKYDHTDIDIDIFQKCRYIDNRYVISIYRTGLFTPPAPSFGQCLYGNKTFQKGASLRDRLKARSNKRFLKLCNSRVCYS